MAASGGTHGAEICDNKSPLGVAHSFGGGPSCTTEPHPETDQRQIEVHKRQLQDQQMPARKRLRKPNINRFLATVNPRSISAHPDHHLFPSFKLLGPDVVHRQLPGNSKEQPRPHSPRNVSLHRIQRHLEDHRYTASFPMPSPPHPAANYLPFLEPVTPSSKKTNNKHKRDSQVPGTLSVSNDSQKMQLHDSPMPSAPCTPHEAMLRAASTTLSWPCISSFQDHPPRTPTAPVQCFVNNSSNSHSTPTSSPTNSFSSDMDREPDTDGLPYGHQTPIIQFLNKKPFVDCVRRVLAACCIQDGHARAINNVERYEPIWQKTYLRINGLRYSGGLSIKPWPVSPMSRPSPTWYQAPDARLLSTYLQSFSTHIQSIYPIIQPGRLKTIKAGFHQHNTPGSQEQQGVPAEHAVELLVFALGSVCWAKCGGTIVEPGPEFYARAKGILELLAPALHVGYSAQNVHSETRSEGRLAFALDLARAHILAGLFCGQLAWVSEAAGHIRNASDVVFHMICQATATPSSQRPLVEYVQHPHTLSGEERQLVLLYWTCVSLEFEINSEACTPHSPLLRYQSIIPPPVFEDIPTFVVGASDTSMANAVETPIVEAVETFANDESVKQERDVRTNFEAQVCLRQYLNRIYDETYGGLKPGDKERIAAEELQLQFQDVSLSQPQSCSAHKSVLTARARAGYWEGLAWDFLPELLRQEQCDETKLAAGIRSLAEVIRAYQGVTGGQPIFPNAMGVVMMQCRYLLLLFAASRVLPVVGEIMGNTLLPELIESTAASLQDTAGPPGVLGAARRMLQAMRDQVQPNTRLDLAPGDTAAALVPASVANLPEAVPMTGTSTGHVTSLSLFCPTFSSSGDFNALATASTSSSFTSFPTPNTSNYWPLGKSPVLHPFSSFGSPISSLSSPLESSFPAATSYAEAKVNVEPALLQYPALGIYEYSSWPVPYATPATAPLSSAHVDMTEFGYWLGLSD